MQAVFVETSGFSQRLSGFLTDAAYAQLQLDLMVNPQLGVVMRGCVGLRKVRVGDASRGKGKRGGARVIYLYIPEAHRFLLLDIYGKGEQEDLSDDERRMLSALAAEFRHSVQHRHASRTRRRS